MTAILITGATGRIGRRLFMSLQSDNIPVRTLGVSELDSLSTQDHVSLDLEWAGVEELQQACVGIHTLYHCAGYAHGFSSLNDSEALLHWRINFEATKRLAEAAGRVGVKRFVFLSSIRASGTSGAQCGDESSTIPPSTAYGKAKAAAEQAILAAAEHHGMEVVNLRLAMVYGGEGRGNLERMVEMVRCGLFPPLPETGNRRSLVYIDDVIDVLRTAALDPRAAGRTYIVADPQAYSGRELYNEIRRALGLKPLRFYIPRGVLVAGAYVGDGLEFIFKRRMPLDSEALGKLLDSDWYSAKRLEEELHWRARVSFPEGLRRMLGCEDKIKSVNE